MITIFRYEDNDIGVTFHITSLIEKTFTFSKMKSARDFIDDFQYCKVYTRKLNDDGVNEEGIFPNEDSYIDICNWEDGNVELYIKINGEDDIYFSVESLEKAIEIANNLKTCKPTVIK